MMMRMFEKEEVAPYASVLVNSSVFSFYGVKILKNSSFTYGKEIFPTHNGIKTPINGVKNWALTVHVRLTWPLHKSTVCKNKLCM